MTTELPPIDPTPATPGIPPGWYHDTGSQRMRWWDGTRWTENFAPTPGMMPAGPSNTAATAALVLGIIGFVLTPIPLFIGLFLGGIPALFGAIFGIVGMARADSFGGRGRGAAVTGFILGLLAIIAIFFGAGTIW